MTLLRLALFASIGVAICACTVFAKPAAVAPTSLSNLETAIRVYLAEVHVGFQKAGAPSGLWNNGGEVENLPAGGIVERILLPVAGEEMILLLRSSLDDRLTPSQTNPPMPETFRVFVSTDDGKWVPQKSDEFGTVIGHWKMQRLREKRYQYGVFWGARDATPRVEIYTAQMGKLLIIERKMLPSQDDMKEKHDELEEAEFNKWLEKAKAHPPGMKQLTAKRQWISLAELIHSDSPKWHDESNTTKSRAGSEPWTGKSLTPEQFSWWLQR